MAAKTLAVLIEELTTLVGPAWTEATDTSKAILAWRMDFKRLPKGGPVVHVLWVSGPMRGWAIQIDIDRPAVGISPPILCWCVYDANSKLQLDINRWNGLIDTLGLASEMFERREHIEGQRR